jgi:uncharacterized caspase-like protein
MDVMARILALLVLVIVLALPASAAQKRMALVIASDKYKMLRPLANAVNDGEAVVKALEAIGFEVIFEPNRDLRRLRRALDDFRLDAAGADVALVYYAGHGVEIGGDNRLLPVDADAASLQTLKDSSLALEEAQAALAGVSKVNLIILDACRNDVFGTAAGEDRAAISLSGDITESVRPGLGRLGRAENTLFAFSAAPGETASDGTDGHSPFATAFVKYFGTEGVEVRSALTLVQREVYDRSRGAQLPYVESGLPQLFFAGETRDALPERERLLLAMADLTDDLRTEVEAIAAEKNVPLATLFGALISNNLGRLSREERGAKLADAANAFVRLREDMGRLSSSDPQVTALRHEAEKQLELGAFDAARAKYDAAATIDSVSRKSLKANFIERTLSEAGTKYLSGKASEAELKHQLAIADFTAAAALFDEVDRENLAAKDWSQQLLVLWDLGDIHVTIGNLAAARQAFERQRVLAERLAKADAGNAQWQRDLSVSFNNVGNVQKDQGDLSGALASFRQSLAIGERLAKADAGNAQWQRDLSVSYDNVGKVQKDHGDLSGALASFRQSLAIAERLAKADAGNAFWQRDLIVSYVKLSEADTDAAAHLRKALAVAEAMKARGILAPVDEWILDELARRLQAAE